MPDSPGTFIVLEGSDGSGKGTQFRLLAERLKAVGYEVETFDFPRYDEPSSHFVRAYLKGEYGPASEISPYSASLFYALDRFEAAPLIRKALAAGKIVLSNRYVGSNMAHQGAKFASEAEQRGFFIWADSLEYQLLNIPRPALSLFLRLPASVSQRLIVARAAKNSTALDQHEADIGHLKSAVTTYDTLCRLFPKDFTAIDCAPEGNLLSIPTVNDLLWEVIKPLLPAKPPKAGRAATVRLDQPQPEKNASEPIKTENGPVLSFLALTELAKSGVRPSLKAMIPFDGKGNSFYMPALSAENSRTYSEYMAKIAGYRQKLREELRVKKIAGADETLGLLLPMAALASLGPLEGAPDAAELETAAVRKGSGSGKLQKLARDGLGANLSTETQPLTLLEVWPRNEFDLLSDSLYGLSDLPRQQMQAGLENLSYDQKYQALNEVLAGNEDAASAHARYRFDVLAEQGLLIELIFSGLINGLRLQSPTPRYGYDVPEIIEEAGLEGEWLECFDLSLGIFSRLQASKDENDAPYVTLGGHRVRFQFNCSLEALASPPRYMSQLFKDFRRDLIEAVSENHPITAEWLKKRPESRPDGGKTKPKNSRNRPKRRRSK